MPMLTLNQNHPVAIIHRNVTEKECFIIRRKSCQTIPDKHLPESKLYVYGNLQIIQYLDQTIKLC